MKETRVTADDIIRELIATGTMNEETLADIESMRVEYGENRLDPDDEAYLRALHARLTNAPLPEPEAPSEPARLDGLSLEEWRDRALRAEAQLAEMRDLQAGAPASS